MTLADDALELLEELQAEDGIDCTITRGATEVSVTVVLARTDSVSLTDREAAITADTQAILVLASDYGALEEPADGDSFVYEDGGQTVTAEARPPAESQKCYTRWRGGGVFRVNCKVVDRS